MCHLMLLWTSYWDGFWKKFINIRNNAGEQTFIKKCSIEDSTQFKTDRV